MQRIRRNMPKPLRFGLVGTVGAAINFAVYFVATTYISLGINMSAVAAFCVAVANNYVLNHRWTFAAENENRPVNRVQFTYYVLGNVMGLGGNLIVLNVLVALAGREFHLMGQLLGIAFGMVFNFIFAKKIVFPVRKTCGMTSQQFLSSVKEEH